MKHAILLVTAILTCLAASMVPFRFIPMIVAISIGTFMVLHGILSRSSTVLEADLDQTQPLPPFFTQG